MQNSCWHLPRLFKSTDTTKATFTLWWVVCVWVYEFLQNKTYQEVGCLVYPTSAMITFVDRLETLFSGIFEGIIHIPHVLARLCKCADDLCTFLKCKEVKCSLWLKSMVKLYMKVWIFHALKRSNVQINQEEMVKCNRKMLRLSYL